MHVSELWRFPVKSMRGESLDAATLTENGVAGDRVVHVRGRRGVLTARTRPRLLSLSGTSDPDGQPLVDGRPWDHPRSAMAIRDAAGADAQAVRYDGQERFDVLPLLVATDGEVRAFGHDRRRLRPNLLIAGVPDLAERSWPGRTLQVGGALIGIHSLRPRCVITTFDPDTGEQDLDVLRRINREFDGKLALNCWVARGGAVRIGDQVEILDVRLPPPPAGGWVTGAPYDVPGTIIR
ncbi:MOSC domain-containing protein [Protofrankia symbiont of Coriaria ruscifolia]|uniref:MOSC domain-containing protein n=1 Tax=Protofrankia symbiont of Coriaria ruscifolia TaxID=1306542 RepID=UPI00104171EC|nr:MOSC N-terminal beta barrel domain-containing protein [Protofrankia symbiont of Coriaria ruscifolia]